MKVFSKFLISVFLIIFVLFFAWPISDEVSWSLTRSFWADRSRVDAGAALIGASFGALLYGLLLGSCLWFMKKLWFPNKKNFDQIKKGNSSSSRNNSVKSTRHDEPLNQFVKETNHASVVSSCAHCAGKPLTKRCHFCFKEPLMKSCPFCAEEVKYAAIKCKHCYSDISESESD